MHAEKRPSNSALYKPLSMKEEEMQMLLEGATAGFIFVVGTDRYQILNISDKVLPILGYSAVSNVFMFIYASQPKEDLEPTSAIIKKELSL